MTTIISLLLLSTAAVAYVIHELHAHNKLKWQSNSNHKGFWGLNSWTRKYKEPFEEPKDNWYTRLVDLEYKEAFFGSSTFAVAITDGAHLMQTIYLMCFSAAIAVHHETWCLWLLIYRAVFGVVFSVCYKLLAR